MWWNKQQLNTISNQLITNIDKLFDHFNIEYVELNKMIRCKCFIHGGDNATALNIYHKADIACHFKCRTHGCELVFGNSVIGMVRGLLSHRTYGWTQSGDQEVSFPETVKFIIGLLQDNLSQTVDYDQHYDTKSDFNYMMSNFVEEPVQQTNLTRIDIRKQLNIPSTYFVGRGFSRSILDTYDVGECKDRTAEMKYRAVVPIYDINYRYVGATGRSLYEKCKQCSGYHHPQSKCMKISKWKHSTGLKRNLCLYNLNNAKSYLRTSHVAVVVESPGNVWRLEEAGIHNAVATFGTTIHETQQHLLDSQGVMALIVIADNDQAGRDAKEIIRKKMGMLYGLYFPIIDTEDVAEMPVNMVKEKLKPLIDNIIGVYR